MIDPIVEFLWSADPLIAFQQALGPDLIGVFQALSALGHPWFMGLLIAILFWLTGPRETFRTLSVLAMGVIVYGLIWIVLQTPRPQDPRLLINKPAALPSFPSGHVVNTTILWGIWAADDRVPEWAPYVMVPLVAFSRLYLGAHFIGDVLFAIPIGLLVLYAFLQLEKPIVWLRERSWWVFVSLALVVVVLAYILTDLIPQAWLVFEAAVGGSLGFLLEERYIDYRPLQPVRQRLLPRLLVGLAVPGMLALLWSATVAWTNWGNFALTALALFWGFFLTPLLFRRLGWSEGL